jgi:hypothetical protein
MIELRTPPLFHIESSAPPYRVAPLIRALGWSVATALLLSVSSSPGQAAPAKAATKAPPATIATVGSRKVDATDIQRAARALATDPLRKRDLAAWRRMLLDRAVDRELLALEAERQGLERDPVLAKRLSEREYMILLRRIHEKVLNPGLTPTKEQLAEIRSRGLHRGVDLHYLILRDDPSGGRRSMALRIYEAARNGASFDSLVMIYSGHPPSRAARGHFGWVLAKDLEPASHEDVRRAKPGDVVGVYSGPYGHEIYKIGSFNEPSDDSLLTLVYQERKRGISRDYERELLRKYHFVLDTTQVRAVVFAAGSETPDSILASLGPDGTRPEKGVRPALGILATCDGDTVTFDEVIRATPPVLGRTGRMRLRDAETLYQLCARVVLPRLTIRDARERGLHRDPDVARELRLSKDRVLTEEMVQRNRPKLPDAAGLRSFYEKNLTDYGRPRTAVTRVAILADRDTAAALHEVARSQDGLSAALLVSRGLTERPGSALPSVAPGTFASVSLAATDADTLSRIATSASAGSLLPLTRLSRGFAVAEVVSIEEARPMTFEEALPLVRRQWVEEAEDRWVRERLVRLRAGTPVRIQPGRLESLKLAPVLSSAGGSNP